MANKILYLEQRSKTFYITTLIKSQLEIVSFKQKYENLNILLAHHKSKTIDSHFSLLFNRLVFGAFYLIVINLFLLYKYDE